MAGKRSFTSEERESYREKKQRQREELESRVRDLVDSFRDSDTFKTYIAQMADFNRRCNKYLHHYSPNNLLFIIMQDPTAQIVGSMNAWRKMGRFVRRGEHSRISVWAPMTEAVVQDKLDQYGNPVLKIDGTPEREFARDDRGRIIRRFNGRFKLEPVFDVSQTDGEPIPEYAPELKNPVEFYGDYVEALRDVSPYPIMFSDDPRAAGIDLGSAKGVCHYGEHVIVVRAGMSEEQSLKTMVHEVTHAKLHVPEALAGQLKQTGDAPSQNEKEVQAECTAYLVCQHFGFDTSDYSIPYIMSWGEDKKLTPLTKSLDIILKTSDEIIDQMETHLWVDMGIDETLEGQAAGVQAAPGHDASEQPADDRDKLMHLLSNKTFASLWGMGFKMKYLPALSGEEKSLVRLERKTDGTLMRIDVAVTEKDGSFKAPDFAQDGTTAIFVFKEGEDAPVFARSEGTLVDQMREYEEIQERAASPACKAPLRESLPAADIDTARELLGDPHVARLVEAGYHPRPCEIMTPAGYVSGLSLEKDNGSYAICIDIVSPIGIAQGAAEPYALKENTALSLFETATETPVQVFSSRFDRSLPDQMACLRENATYKNLAALKNGGFEQTESLENACRFSKKVDELDVTLAIPLTDERAHQAEGVAKRLDFDACGIQATISDGVQTETITRIGSVARAIEQVSRRIESIRCPSSEKGRENDPISYVKGRRHPGRSLAERHGGAPSLRQSRPIHKNRDYMSER